MPLQPCMEIRDSASGVADWVLVPPFSERTPQSPWDGPFQGDGVESLYISRNSDSGGTVQFLSWLWNTGPAVYPHYGPEGCMRVCSTNLPALWTWGVTWGWGGGYIWSMGFQANFYGPFSPCITGARAWFALLEISKTCFKRCWTPPRLPFATTSVHNFRTESVGIPIWCTVSSLISSRSHRCFLQMMWSCRLHGCLTSSFPWGSL